MWNSRTDNIFGGENKHAGRYLSARKYECYVLPKNSWKKRSFKQILFDHVDVNEIDCDLPR